MDRWGELTTRAGRLAGELAQVQAELVDLTVELLSDSGWAGDGVRSPQHWLQVYTGLSPAQARGVVRVAERAEGLVAVRELMAEGRMTLDQAAPIAEHVPDASVAEVAGLGEVLSVTQLRRVVARYPFERRPKPWEEPGPKPSHRDTVLSMSSFGGRFMLKFSTTAVEGAVVEQAVREAKDALFASGEVGATLADGLLQVAARSLAAVGSVSRRDAYKVVLHLSTDGTGWVGRRGAVPGCLLDRFTCSGSVRPVWEQDSVPVAVGRSQRIVPDRTRMLVEDRDTGCRYPGCGASGFVENHHIVHWKDGGVTDPSNLVSLCPQHHRKVHLDSIGITGDPDKPDGLVFTTGLGFVIGRRWVPAERSVRPEPVRVGVRGERLDLGAVHFNTAEAPVAVAEREPCCDKAALTSDWDDQLQEMHDMVHHRARYLEYMDERVRSRGS